MVSVSLAQLAPAGRGWRPAGGGAAMNLVTFNIYFYKGILIPTRHILIRILAILSNYNPFMLISRFLF